MSRRARPHPARTARRVAGASLIGTYGALVAIVGWSQRSAEADAATPEPAPDNQSAQAARSVEPLDLGAPATFKAPEASTPTQSVTTTTPIVAVVPAPPPPPSAALTTTTTTTAPAVLASIPVPPSSAVPTTVTTTTVAPTTSSTTVPPTTTTPTTTFPPTTTVFTGAS